MIDPEVPRSPRRRMGAHKGAVLGLLVFAALILFVSIGPLIWTKDPGFINPDAAAMMKTRNSPPSWAFPLGTDQLGRDLLARMMQGGRVSMAVGVVAMVISIALGTGVGLCAGYFRRLDGPLMRLTDLFLALPLLPLLLVMIMLFRDTLAAALGAQAGAFLLIVGAIGLTAWMPTARIVRAEVLAIKERDFVLAARSIGTPARRIIRRHILPNVASPILVSATLGLATAILTESALSFLGLGFPPDFPTWGRMLFEGADGLQNAPQRVIWPGLAISLTVIAVNYMGEGLRDALDPHHRGR